MFQPKIEEDVEMIDLSNSDEELLSSDEELTDGLKELKVQVAAIAKTTTKELDALKKQLTASNLANNAIVAQTTKEMDELKKQLKKQSAESTAELKKQLKKQLAENTAVYNAIGDNIYKAMREAEKRRDDIAEERAEKFETKLLKLFSNNKEKTNNLTNNTDEGPCHSRGKDNANSRPTLRSKNRVHERKNSHVQKVASNERPNASGLNFMTDTDLRNLKNESESCVRFIGKLIIEVFEKDFFLTHTFKHVKSAQIDHIYRIVKSQYSKIIRRGKTEKELTRDDVVSVFKHKIKTIRTAIYK